MISIASRTLFKHAPRQALAKQARSYVTAASTETKKAIVLKDRKHTAHATASGQGRKGVVKSEDFALRFAMPKSLGGQGDGQNPEQLFAMGYASCFLGALQMMAGRMGKKDAANNAVIHVDVHLGEAEKLGGFGLAVDIKVEGVKDEELIKAGHEACPYSRALTHGAVVNVSKA